MSHDTLQQLWQAQYYIKVASQLTVWIYQLACQLTASDIEYWLLKLRTTWYWLGAYLIHGGSSGSFSGMGRNNIFNTKLLLFKLPCWRTVQREHAMWSFAFGSLLLECSEHPKSEIAGGWTHTYNNLPCTSWIMLTFPTLFMHSKSQFHLEFARTPVT